SRRTTTAAHHSLGSRFRSGPICHVLHRVRGNLERHRRDWRSRRGACRQEQCEWQVNAHTANPCLRTSAQTCRLLRYSCCVGGLYTRESFDWEPSTECEGCARTPSGWIVASDFRPSGQPAREQKRHRSVRLASGQMASWPANARDAHQPSTSNLSTFLHPRGNTAPRWARSPRYSLRSAYLIVILRPPLWTMRLRSGGTTAIAARYSSREATFFEDKPKILLPLPRGSSGRSFTGKASIFPSELTAHNSASSAAGTGAGASTPQPSGTFSTALPARLRECSSPSLTTKP